MTKPWRYGPAPTPKRLHKERLERERNAEPRDDRLRVDWRVNAEIMRRMDEEYAQ